MYENWGGKGPTYGGTCYLLTFTLTRVSLPLSPMGSDRTWLELHVEGVALHHLNHLWKSSIPVRWWESISKKESERPLPPSPEEAWKTWLEMMFQPIRVLGSNVKLEWQSTVADGWPHPHHTNLWDTNGERRYELSKSRVLPPMVFRRYCIALNRKCT